MIGIFVENYGTMVDFRIGHGYDVHALGEGLRLVLGGVEIQHTKGCIAHSDGDVLVHAICDALLGALALGDIGKHFPDTSAEFKGIDSLILLRRVVALIEEHGYLRDTNRRGRIHSIITRLAENNVKRAAQARLVRRFIEQSPVRNIVVCGDFNDVPLSYTYRHIAKDLNNGFAEAGRGYTYTFNGFFRLLSIDYLLTSNNIEVVSYETDHEATYTDHYPLIARLKIIKQEDNENKQ
jgi:2C-methyl-D-erythritol 2,4-cyclodiphosphate synthase